LRLNVIFLVEWANKSHHAAFRLRFMARSAGTAYLAVADIRGLNKIIVPDSSC